MAENARDDFSKVSLTMEGRIRRLSEADRSAVSEIERNHDEQKRQLAAEQAQRRQEDIAAERQRITGGHAAPAYRPRGLGAGESFAQFNARVQRDAEHSVDAKNTRALDAVEAQKQKEVERRVEEAERRQAEQERKRAEELARAAERARQIQAQARSGHDRGR